MSSKIFTYHIGGRNETGGLRFPEKFSNDVVCVMFDADPSCAADSSSNLDTEGGHIILPYGVSGQSGTAKFYINYDPFSSSCLLLNEDFAGYYSEFGGADYVFGESNRPVREIELEMKDLNTIISDMPKHIKAPDFLSLDVEGLEYDILSGAKDVLNSNVFGVIAEFQMQQVHNGQKVFYDIFQLLDSCGFFLADFLDMSGACPYRYPVGVRGNSPPMHGDALFLRRLETIENIFPNEDARFCAFYKYAFIALQFGYVEYALEAMKMADKLSPGSDVKDALQKRLYFSALKEVAAAAESMPRQFPKTFAQTYTKEDAYQRGVVGEKNPHTGIKRVIKAFLIENPGLLRAVRFLRASVKSIKGGCKAGYEAIFASSTPLEETLRKYDMLEVAELVAKRRRSMLKAMR